MYNVECSCGNVRPRASRVRRRPRASRCWCDPNGDPAGARGGKFWPVSDVNNSFWPVRTLRMRHGMRRGAYGAVYCLRSAALKDVMKSHSLLDSPNSSSRSQEPITGRVRRRSERTGRARLSARLRGPKGGVSPPDPPSRVGMGNVRRGTDPTHACIVPSRQLSLRIRTVALSGWDRPRGGRGQRPPVGWSGPRGSGGGALRAGA
jgi:hypothetical protein